MAAANVEVRFVIHEGMWDRGQYQASITVKATDEAEWTGAGAPAKTPLAAFEEARRSLQKELTPGKAWPKAEGARQPPVAQGWLALTPMDFLPGRLRPPRPATTRRNGGDDVKSAWPLCSPTQARHDEAERQARGEPEPEFQV
jgi:hypothetical protein